ncbi:MAG TPA: hypothetical protein VI894_02490 [Candidatus Nanoarchaeia archaeon]|nr:hypothetical protein [Candidatus Nanoarchaeia archaeon]
MEQYEIFFNSAELVLNSKDYTSASTLYFKAIFTAIDSIIQKRIGRTPKDHGERFRMLEKEFKGYYLKLNSLFVTYRDTYSKIISKEVCEEIKNEAKFFISEAKKRS